MTTSTRISVQIRGPARRDPGRPGSAVPSAAVELHTSEIAEAVDGEVFGRHVDVAGAGIDSRTVRPGQLFVPIVDARDGHDFIGAAVRAGAPAYLTSGPIEAGTAIRVADTGRALLDLGRHARTRLPERVIGITGSVGKTSTKDLLAAILSSTYRTAASERSFNNELGVPLTLVNAPDTTEATVVEMGARGPGHIALLCDVARPTIGVVTVVAGAHLELFGSIEDVARAKGELVEALPVDGTAVLNADDHRVAAMAARTEAGLLTFGVDAGDVRAEGIRLDDDLRASFRLRTPDGDADVRLAVHGAHQVTNALAAVAAALAAGVPLASAVETIADAELSALRMQLDTLPSGARLLNDAYNANPTSVHAALDALGALAAIRHTAVLGTMAELGAEGAVEHARVAAHAADLGIRVISVAEPAYGIEGADAVEDIDGALARLGALDPDDAVLVKASRVVGLERLAERLASPT